MSTKSKTILIICSAVAVALAVCGVFLKRYLDKEIGNIRIDTLDDEWY